MTFGCWKIWADTCAHHTSSNTQLVIVCMRQNCRNFLVRRANMGSYTLRLLRRVACVFTVLKAFICLSGDQNDFASHETSLVDNATFYRFHAHMTFAMTKPPVDLLGTTEYSEHSSTIVLWQVKNSMHTVVQIVVSSSTTQSKVNSASKKLFWQDE